MTVESRRPGQEPGQCPDAPRSPGEEEHRQRVDGLRRQMRLAGADCAVLWYSRDLLYYSGTAVYCTLVIPVEKDPVLLARINGQRARSETWIKDVRDSGGLDDVRETLRELGLAGGAVGIEEDVTPLASYRRLAELLPRARFVDISPLILRQRMVKSPAEVELIRRAAQGSRSGLDQVKAVLREGVTESEVASWVELVKRRAGHEAVMVYRRQGAISNACFVMSGPNLGVISGYWIAIVGSGPSAALPYGPSYRCIRRGDMVDVNHGTCFRGYHCDEGKMFVLGKATEEQKLLFSVVRQAQEAAIAAIRPGVRASEVYQAAARVVEDKGYGPNFMARGQYGVEYLGHGVGLEIDEQPLISPRNHTILEEGMTLALEPKLIFPGVTGVDIEDTVLVTPGGCEVLTSGHRDLAEVDA